MCSKKIRQLNRLSHMLEHTSCTHRNGHMEGHSARAKLEFRKQQFFTNNDHLYMTATQLALMVKHDFK